MEKNLRLQLSCATLWVECYFQKHLSTFEDEIDALAKEIEEYKIIQSIPGIGEKIAATIISEIGEIDRFNLKSNSTFQDIA